MSIIRAATEVSSDQTHIFEGIRKVPPDEIKLDAVICSLFDCPFTKALDERTTSELTP